MTEAAGLNNVSLGDILRKGNEPRFGTIVAILKVSNGGIAGVNHLYASDDVVGSMHREIETLTEEIKSKNRQIDTLLTMLNERVKQ